MVLQMYYQEISELSEKKIQVHCFWWPLNTVTHGILFCSSLASTWWKVCLPVHVDTSIKLLKLEMNDTERKKHSLVMNMMNIHMYFRLRQYGQSHSFFRIRVYLWTCPHKKSTLVAYSLLYSFLWSHITQSVRWNCFSNQRLVKVFYS